MYKRHYWAFLFLFSSRFHLLAHVNIFPKLDVAAAQKEIHSDLKKPYIEGLLQLHTDTSSICVKPLGRKHLSTVRSSCLAKCTETLIWSLFDRKFSHRDHQPSDSGDGFSSRHNHRFTTYHLLHCHPENLHHQVNNFSRRSHRHHLHHKPCKHLRSVWTSALHFRLCRCVEKSFWYVSTSSTEIYFEVKVNVSISGDCDPQQILPIWVCLTNG